MTAHHQPSLASAPGSLPALWLGWIVAPAWWLAQFEARYALVHWACLHGSRWGVLGWGAVALAAAAALAGWSWHHRSEATLAPSARFLSTGGACIATFFAFLVLAQMGPDLFLDPCRQ